MARAERLADIVETVVSSGAVSVEQVMAVHGVSAATARRDLDLLADQQLITRTRGGARANRTTGEVPMRGRAGHRVRQKLAIARTVVELLVDGEVVAFNGGTTTTATAYELGVRTAERYPHDDAVTTVVTNAVNIANDLAVRTQLRVMLTGGVARARSYELVGPLAEALLPRIHIDTLVLGVTAISPAGVLLTQHEGEAAVNAALVKAAERIVVVADSSKFDRTEFARICSLSDVDVLVTDAGVSDAQREMVTGLGLELVVAPGA